MLRPVNVSSFDRLTKDPVQTVKKREVLIVLPFLGYHSRHLTKQLRSCKNKFYGIFNVKIDFQNTRRIKSFFPYKNKLAPSFKSKVVYRANCAGIAMIST